MFCDLSDLADTAEVDCFTTTRKLTPDEHAEVVRLHEEWLAKFCSMFNCKASHCLTLLGGWIVAWAVEDPMGGLTGTVLDPLFNALSSYLRTLSPPAEWRFGDVFVVNNEAYPFPPTAQLIREGGVTSATIGDVLFIAGERLGKLRNGLLHPLRDDDSFEVYRDALAMIAAREGLPW